MRVNTNPVDAAVVTAAGGFDLLIVEPEDATGATALARRIPALLPGLTLKESDECTEICQTAGLIERTDRVRERPFRAPHHTVGTAGLRGCETSKVRPGEISLAHCGVLFCDGWDEMSEGKRALLWEYRAAKRVQMSEYAVPADFLLVACSTSVQPGFDVICQLPTKREQALAYAHTLEQDAALFREKIEIARCRQRARHLDMFGVPLLNSELSEPQLNRAQLPFENSALPLAGRIQKLDLYTPQLRAIALTLADMRCLDYINEDCLCWAFQLVNPQHPDIECQTSPTSGV